MSEVTYVTSIPTTTQKSSTYRESYANNSRLALTPVDLVIVFGRVTDTNNVPVIEDDYLVRMSPQAFKIFAANIASLVATWESQFGEIYISRMSRPPSEIMRSLQTKMAEDAISRVQNNS